MAAAAQDEARDLQRIADLGITPVGGGYRPMVETERAMDDTDTTATMLEAVIPA